MLTQNLRKISIVILNCNKNQFKQQMVYIFYSTKLVSGTLTLRQSLNKQKHIKNHIIKQINI